MYKFIVILWFSGGEGRFTINPDTGEVIIAERLPFELNQQFPLAISASQVRAAHSITRPTPAQILTVTTVDLAPQFQQEQYVISIPENSPENEGYVFVNYS